MKLLLNDSGRIRVIADSAIGRNRQPWFIPDEGENWRWRSALAFRVSKLGKNVSAKFIGRYIDAVTLLWVAEADDFDALDYMDGAVVCGNWIDFDSEVAIDAFSEITRNTTIKNGDILAYMLPEHAAPIIRNQHISLQYKNQEVISFNIK